MSTLPKSDQSHAGALLTTGDLRVLLVEGDAGARAALRHILPSLSGVRVVGEAADCLAASALLNLHAPDLVLLDVELPGSREWLASLADREHRPAVIVSAFEPALLRAFQEGTVDGVLKPATPDRVEKAVLLGRVEVLRSNSERLLARLHAAENPAPTHYLQRISAQVGDRTVVLPVRDVDCFRSAGNYVRLQVGDETFTIRHTLRALELVLDPQHFQRIHRGIIVNVDSIASLHSSTSGMRVLLRSGVILRLGRSYRGELRHLLRNIF